MGLFSKIWKGIKKTFKKIGKGIKKAFKSFGKFMNKIGIVGQIAMSFILPGIGGVLAKTFGNVVGALSGGALGAVGKAAGWVLGKAGEFAKMAYKGYKTVTGAITDFIGTTGKYVGGKLGIGDNMSFSQAFGKEGWGGRLTDSFSELGDAAKEFWDTDIKGVLPDTNVNITKPQMPTGDEVEELAALKVEATATGDYSKVPLSMGTESYTIGDAGQVSNVSSYSILGDPASSAAAVETAATSADKGWLETLTGEKTFGDVGKKLVTETRDYAYAAPGKAISSAVQTAGLQGLGLAAKPMGDPGPVWGPRVGFESPSKYYDTSQVLQPIQPLSFGDYVNTYAMGGENQGTYLGSGFWESYMQRSLAA